MNEMSGSSSDIHGMRAACEMRTSLRSVIVLTIIVWWVVGLDVSEKLGLSSCKASLSFYRRKIVRQLGIERFKRGVFCSDCY